MKEERLMIGEKVYRPWTPTGPNGEAALSKAALAHSRLLLGDDYHVFPLEKKIMSIAGVGAVPDAIAIDLKNKKWGLVEFELQSHPEYSHIMTQLSKFQSATKTNFKCRLAILDSVYERISENTQLYDQIRGEMGTKDLHKGLDFILKIDPFILVAVDQVTSRLEEALQNVKGDIRVAEIEIYVPAESSEPGGDFVLRISMDIEAGPQPPGPQPPKRHYTPPGPQPPPDLTDFESRLRGWKRQIFKSMVDIVQVSETRAICVAKGSREAPYVNFILGGHAFVRVRHTLQTYFYPDLRGSRGSSLRINYDEERKEFLEQFRSKVTEALEKLRENYAV